MPGCLHKVHMQFVWSILPILINSKQKSKFLVTSILYKPLNLAHGLKGSLVLIQLSASSSPRPEKAATSILEQPGSVSQSDNAFHVAAETSAAQGGACHQGYCKTSGSNLKGGLPIRKSIFVSRLDKTVTKHDMKGVLFDNATYRNIISRDCRQTPKTTTKV